MKQVLFSVFFFCVCISGPLKADMSYSEFSDIKSNAEKFGRLVGAMRACEGLPDEMQVSLAQYTDIGSSDLKAYVIKELESAGLEYADLEKIDEAITKEDNNSYEQFWQPLISSPGSDQMNFCGSLYIGVSAYKVYDTLKDLKKPSEIMAEFARISILK